MDSCIDSMFSKVFHVLFLSSSWVVPRVVVDLITIQLRSGAVARNKSLECAPPIPSASIIYGQLQICQIAKQEPCLSIPPNPCWQGWEDLILGTKWRNSSCRQRKIWNTIYAIFHHFTPYSATSASQQTLRGFVSFNTLFYFLHQNIATI